MNDERAEHYSCHPCHSANVRRSMWQYWQKRMKIKHDERNTDRSEQTMFRDDLRERVAILEQKLEESIRRQGKDRAKAD